jgi:hypothetical protein
VYVHDTHGRDLLLIGRVGMGLANGKSVSGEFVARVLLDESAEEGKPRIKLYQVWAVCSYPCFPSLSVPGMDISCSFDV